MGISIIINTLFHVMFFLKLSTCYYLVNIIAYSENIVAYSVSTNLLPKQTQDCSLSDCKDWILLHWSGWVFLLQKMNHVQWVKRDYLGNTLRCIERHSDTVAEHSGTVAEQWIVQCIGGILSAAAVSAAPGVVLAWHWCTIPGCYTSALYRGGGFF